MECTGPGQRNVVGCPATGGLSSSADSDTPARFFDTTDRCDALSTGHDRFTGADQPSAQLRRDDLGDEAWTTVDSNGRSSVRTPNPAQDRGEGNRLVRQRGQEGSHSWMIILADVGSDRTGGAHP